MRPYHVAIVGSGPSGFFAAASLLKAADASDETDVAVDMLEMLPTPWGLVRSGVAPDHPKIKSISKQFEKTAEDPRFRFFGNVVIGEHVEAAELAEDLQRDGIDVVLAGDVADDAVRVWVVPCDALHGVGGAGDEGDVGSAARQLADEGEAESGGAAGDGGAKSWSGMHEHSSRRLCKEHTLLSRSLHSCN